MRQPEPCISRECASCEKRESSRHTEWKIPKINRRIALARICRGVLTFVDAVIEAIRGLAMVVVDAESEAVLTLGGGVGRGVRGGSGRGQTTVVGTCLACIQAIKMNEQKSDETNQMPICSVYQTKPSHISDTWNSNYEAICFDLYTCFSGKKAVLLMIRREEHATRRT